MNEPSPAPESRRTEYYTRPGMPRGALAFLIVLSIVMIGAVAFFLYQAMDIGSFGPALGLLSLLFLVLLVVLLARRFQMLLRNGRFMEIRKSADFLGGFFGTIILGFFANFFVGLYAVSGGGLGLVILLVPLAIFALVAWAFSRNGRRYVMIGMLSSVLIPLLVFGACLYILQGI